MRIAIGGFCHETNSLGKNMVDKETLMDGGLEGEVLIRGNVGVRSYNGGFVDEAAQLGVTVIPTVYYFHRPSGPCSREAVEAAIGRLVELLCAAYEKEPYDGIAMFMHGAGAAEGCPDIEGQILSVIRERLGHDIPIGVALDLHGNVSSRMMECANLLVGCKHYPHVDEYETGRLVFRSLCRMIEKNYRPFKSMVKLPWLMVPAQGVTTAGPARDVQQLCMQLENEREGLLHASFFQGFPYADVEDAGVGVVTVAMSKETSEECAHSIARYAWQWRSAFAVPLDSAEEAVDLALAQTEFPVIINESADNPGGIRLYLGSGGCKAGGRSRRGGNHQLPVGWQNGCLQRCTHRINGRICQDHYLLRSTRYPEL